MEYAWMIAGVVILTMMSLIGWLINKIFSAGKRVSPLSTTIQPQSLSSTEQGPLSLRGLSLAPSRPLWSSTEVVEMVPQGDLADEADHRAPNGTQDNQVDILAEAVHEYNNRLRDIESERLEEQTLRPPYELAPKDEEDGLIDPSNRFKELDL